MTAVQLPYDVWECISLYVPDRHLRTLYGVNRALYCAALNRKYRHVEFSDFGDEKMSLLHALKDPVVARRVKTLHVNTFAVFTSYHRRGPTIHSSDDIIRAMTDAISGMLNVHEVRVNWRDHIFSHDLVPFFCALWKRVAPTLRVLSLSAPAGRFRALLNMVLPHAFPHLQSVEFQLDRTTTDTHGADPLHVVAKFINSARATIDSLVLRSQVDLNPSVMSLALLPRLRKLSLFLPILQEDVLLRMLVAHADSLTDFSWGLSTPELDDENPEQLDGTLTRLCHHEDLVSMTSLGLYITLPSFVPALTVLDRNLYSLTRLHLDGLALDVPQLRDLSAKLGADRGSVLSELKLTVDVLGVEVVDILSRLPTSLYSITLAFHHMLSIDQWSIESTVASPRHHLRHLDVHGVKMYLSLDGVAVLLNAFSHFMGISASLESLNLVVHTLNPQLMDVLFFSVPHLYEFWLRIIELNGEEEGNDRWMTRLGAFEMDMKSRKYSDWPLHDARVTSTYFDGTMLRQTEHTEIVGVLAQSIPGLLAC